MKRLVFVVLAIIIMFNAKAQLKMDCDGDVVVGNYASDPTYDFEVRGHSYFSCSPGASSGFYFTNYSTVPTIKPQWNNSARAGLYNNKFYYMYTNWLYYDNLYDWSDIGIKENIRNIESPLAAICQIRGIKYDLKRDYYANSPEDKMDEIVQSGKDKYGVIAQELKEILPDLVNYNDEAELYAVNYVGLIPVLVEAIKEQQVMIQTLQVEVQELKGNSNLKSASTSTSVEESSANSENTLMQNSPNPFTDNTEIGFALSENIQHAVINIYSLNGTQLRSIEVSQRGTGIISISGGEFDAGMYTYALIADGSIISTRQMVLTD